LKKLNGCVIIKFRGENYEVFKKQKGFTLTELMVVVTVMAVLVVVAVPTYNSVSKTK
jgi:prepilin-type N-terminal cleavage/methylation domain-containing protein